MKAAKALRLFNALEALAPVEGRFQFAVRLTVGSEDAGKSRAWIVRVTPLHGASDWREVFAIIEEADNATYGDGEVWPKTKIRIENAGIELS